MIKFDHKHHKELWDFLSKNPDKGKEDWAGWKRNGGTVEEICGLCFACEADNNGCNDCPICEHHEKCLNGLYTKWDHSTGEQRSKYAEQIRDLPLRTDIEIELIGEDKVEFKVGDRVRIRQWDDMAKEFGVNSHNNIKVACAFGKEMKHLCGRTAIIKEMVGRRVQLSDWSNNSDVKFNYSLDMLELVSIPSHKITIISDGNTTTATYGNKQGIAKCNPSDTFDFAIGAKLALERALEPEFAPYLKDDINGAILGEIGQSTSIVDIQGTKLCIGDTVTIYSDYGYHGESPIVRKNNYAFVMGLQTFEFEHPTTNIFGLIIIKKRSYTEVKHNKTVADIKYIKEAQ